MGRKRLPEDERKEFVGIRLPRWLIDKIRKKGTLQNVIENLLRNIFGKD